MAPLANGTCDQLSLTRLNAKHRWSRACLCYV